jgi:hypothetical protein|tara:strand:- start:6139 stop:6312 length:174 start_codon:yes stop_codon:yes gene_type:complete
METIQEIDLEISQIKKEIEVTESHDTRRMLKQDLQELIKEREFILFWRRRGHDGSQV